MDTIVLGQKRTAEDTMTSISKMVDKKRRRHEEAMIEWSKYLHNTERQDMFFALFYGADHRLRANLLLLLLEIFVVPRTLTDQGQSLINQHHMSLFRFVLLPQNWSVSEWESELDAIAKNEPDPQKRMEPIDMLIRKWTETRQIAVSSPLKRKMEIFVFSILVVLCPAFFNWMAHSENTSKLKDPGGTYRFLYDLKAVHFSVARMWQAMKEGTHPDHPEYTAQHFVSGSKAPPPPPLNENKPVVYESFLHVTVQGLVMHVLSGYPQVVQVFDI